MSGGSYNYLCHAGTSEILEYLSDIQEMSDRLAELGYAKDAARETQELALMIRQFENRADAIMDRLAAVWQSVEWWDSNDWGEDSVKEALEKYRQGE